MVSLATTSFQGTRATPLCCEYAVVSYGSLVIPSPGADRTVYWLFGTLIDGQAELLGIWLADSAHALPWESVCSDISERGVERVRVVLDRAPCERWSAIYPGCAEVDGSPAQSTQLASRLRLPAEIAREGASRIRQRLSRALSRHSRDINPGDVLTRLAEHANAIDRWNHTSRVAR